MMMYFEMLRQWFYVVYFMNSTATIL